MIVYWIWLSIGNIEDLIFCCVIGMGYGVGVVLNVYEGFQSVSVWFGNMIGLEQGMIVSNEFGYYEDWVFGICIEV